ncbi:MAG: hypothetical protein CMM87_06380 [Rickettsiales bacterium]|nr:hypothetical protein [Rickettsiales bacterium]|tara:strand:- start:41720 stop:42511 length:792 start_codon:yes stop_codon:yes gene_type:complete
MGRNKLLYRNKYFLYGVATALVGMIALVIIDRGAFEGRLTTRNSEFKLLEGDLARTTEEALELEQHIEVLKKQIAIIKPLAALSLEQQQQLMESERAFTQAQEKIMSLSLVMDNLKNQFWTRLKLFSQRYPGMIDYKNGRYSFNTALFFASASADLNDQGKEMLDQFAEFLGQFIAQAPLGLNWFIRVDGHTDDEPIDTPEFPSNWQLASARAIAVTEYLIEKGVPAKYLVPASFNSYWPLVKGEGDQSMEQNRRIEFTLSHY